MTKNKPYVKVHVKGVLLNPITKDKPYLHQLPSISQLKRTIRNSSNNKKGVRLTVTKIDGRAIKVINEEDDTTQWNVVLPEFTKFKTVEQIVFKPRVRKGLPRTNKKIYHYV